MPVLVAAAVDAPFRIAGPEKRSQRVFPGSLHPQDAYPGQGKPGDFPIGNVFGSQVGDQTLHHLVDLRFYRVVGAYLHHQVDAAPQIETEFEFFPGRIGLVDGETDHRQDQ